ncbi:terminase large subunit domain-containing protein [Klebsiella pneumoniae]
MQKKINGARRFRKVFIQLARKNAKSQFLAIVAAFCTFLGDEKQRAYIAGWTRDQSSEVYEAVKTGISSSELLEGKWKEAYSTIEIFKNGSVVVPLSKEARKTGDGKNPSLGIVDEYHAHETDEIYDVLSSGMVAKERPLMFIITTAGFDLSRPCYRSMVCQ